MGATTRLRRLATALAVGTVAAACSTGGGAHSSSAGAQPGAGAHQSTTSVAPGSGGRLIAGGQPDPNGVLRFGIDMSANFTSGSFDPAQSINSCDKIDQGLLYDTLTQLGPHGELEPGLATSWTFDSSSLTVHLRPGVSFSDGSPADANAVRQSLLHVKTSPLRTSLAIIKAIAVVDPLTLRLDLTTATAPDLLYAWNDLDGMVIAPSALGSAASHPVGSGPYTLASASPSEVVLKKNPSYWNASAYQPAEIHFVQVGIGPPAIAALKAGSIDMASFQPESLPVVKADSTLGYSLRPSHEYMTIQFRLDTKPVDNQAVRQAINYAVDRKEINSTVLGGTGTVTDETFAPDQPVAFNASVAQEYTYDPARARALLAEAGYPNGITFSMVVPAGVTLFEREAPLLQNEMARAGITAKIVTVDPGQLETSFYTHKQNDALAAEYPAEEEYARELYDKYGKTGFGAILTGSVRPELEDLLVKGMGTLDDAALTPLMQQAAKITTDEALEVPIAFVSQMLAFGGRVGGHPSAGSDACRADFTGLFIKR